MTNKAPKKVVTPPACQNALAEPMFLSEKSKNPGIIITRPKMIRMQPETKKVIPALIKNPYNGAQASASQFAVSLSTKGEMIRRMRA